MAAPKNARGGAPTREQRVQKQMAEAFETLSRAMEIQAKALERMTEREDVKRPQPSARAVDVPDGYDRVIHEPGPDEDAVVYKSKKQGQKQVIQSSYKIARGDGDYEIVPAKVVEFEKGTFRTADPEVIKALDEKAERQRRKNLPPRYTKFEKQVGAILNKGRDLEHIKSDKIKTDTPVEESLGLS